MSETAAFIALIETASVDGVEARKIFIDKHGPHELGWSYSNILEVEKGLNRQISRKGYFRLYLYIPNGNGGVVLYRMVVTGLRTFSSPQVFNDPVDGRRYLVHSRMMIDSIEKLSEPMELSFFRSVDSRMPDIRHLQLGFLFVVDPEV